MAKACANAVVMALPNCANLETKISLSCFASCHGRLAGFWIGRVHRAGVRVMELPALSYCYPPRCRCPIGTSSLLQSPVKQFGLIGGQVRLMPRSAGTRATSIARGHHAKQIGAPQGSHTIVRSASLALPFQRNLYPGVVSELRINWYRTGYPYSIGIAMQIWRKGSAKKRAALGGPLEK